MKIEDFSQGKYQFAHLFSHGDPDGILKGRYCEVRYYWIASGQAQGDVNFTPFWKSVGSDCETATDEERIASAIANMPHSDFFINFTSFDQVREWIGIKDYCVQIAQCFLAERGQQDDALLTELEAVQIDQFSYDYAWAATNIYKSLWRILEKRGRAIKHLLEKGTGNYPFTSSRDLLIEIIREDLEGEFIGCLKRRYTYKASQIAEIAKLKRKEHRTELTNLERKKLYRLIDQYIPYAKWFNYSVLAADKLAETDHFTNVHLEAYRASLAELAKLQIQRDCKPDLKKHRRSSHTWEQGKCIEGALNWNA
ncbi:hypothetical protein [Stenomitos frigidus]|uniref:Uncharacterized protein n=1 Tax=Stenomitos frigidus ULC18 TaxID=2107698 RepID=A0A2T1DXX2_9CYAN|nr:hypothetical protein [Stenomitos frigidus]PSB25347.1 hypothetical protein C7B82_23750 [Stenomitos frigidus ULC18]